MAVIFILYYLASGSTKPQNQFYLSRVMA